MPKPTRTIAAVLTAASRRWASFTVAFALVTSTSLGDGPKPDEEVTLYPTTGWFDAAARQWVVPVRGCIYEPETNSVKRRALLALLAERLKLDESQTPLFRERARPFLVDHERAKVLDVACSGATCRCGPSQPNGQFTAEVRIGLPEGAAAPKSDDTVTLSIQTRDGDTRSFSASAQLLAPTGICVITDIDDTVKLTDVPDVKEMLRNTFLRPYQAVPGMPRLLTALRDAGASVHYVSASPWQLLAPLQAMFAGEGLPAGSMHLKTFRWKDETFFDLFASPESFKLPILREQLRRYPGRRFILIGDTSERDPEIYAQIAREFPDQVAAILIRIAAPSQWSTQRSKQAFKDVPAPVTAFTDPAEVYIPSVLESAGVSKASPQP